MNARGQRRLTALCALLWVGLSLFSGAAAAAAPIDPSALLQQADDIKTSNNTEFKQTLDTLNARKAELTPQEQAYLGYLQAWQAAYEADYGVAVPALNELADNSPDPTLRFRAGMTAVNVLAIARRYEEAYARLGEMMALLPQVPDHRARRQGLNVASFLYERAGQFDLAVRYADEQMREEPGGNGVCTAGNHRLHALFRGGKFDVFNREVQAGIAACMQAHEPLWANFLRVDVAKLALAQGRPAEALKLMKDHYEEARATKYAELTAAVDAILAQASLASGAPEAAHNYAMRVVDGGLKGEITESLIAAYQVLYTLAKQQGDDAQALDYHEKFAAADKGYLNDTSARTLAFQMVNQQVLDKKRQIDALNEKNQRLVLQQEVDAKTTETARLYIALLILVLASIAFWAYKTKRSQLRFMRLARRDGLTGIFNRQHFIDAAGDQLRYCAKSARDACVIVIDLDHFKSVNDVYGHATGDLVLKRAVKTCEDRLRSIDIFGRLGGEEFGIVMPDCALEQALRCAEDLRAAIAAVSGSDARIEFPVSASFGIAATHTSGYDLRELLANADSALYEAKRQGRDRVAAYESSNTVRSVEAAAKAAGTR